MKVKSMLLIAIVFLLCNITMIGYAKEESREFERQSDEYFLNVLEQEDIAGLGVSVVVNGELLFSKGYGYSNYKEKGLFDESTTLQIASVSKVFVSVAVMQLVEEGLVSLDEDINHYLEEFRVENPFDKPVTLRMLLTHTSGFDDQIPIYYSSKDGVLFDQVNDLESTLRNYMPSLVREPGTFCQYNVFGMSLVAYIVEVQSGLKFEDYVKENIFERLQMNHSFYGLSEQSLIYLSKPYYYRFGTYIEGSYTLLNDHPSGSIISSVKDMGKFMIANMGSADSELLSDQAIKTIFSHQYPQDQDVLGFGLAYMEAKRNGYVTYEHGGYLPSFTSKLSLYPEKKMGVFISYNTKSNLSEDICNDYIEKFYNYFMSEPIIDSPLRVDLDMDYKKINGVYSNVNYSMKDSTKIKKLLLNSRIKCDSNGILYFNLNSNLEFYYIGNGKFFNKENSLYCQVDLQKGVFNILGTDYERIHNYDILLFYLCILSIPFLLIDFIRVIIELIKKIKNGVFEKNHMMFLGLAVNIGCYYGLQGIMSISYVVGRTDIVVNVILKLFFPVSVLCLISTLLFIRYGFRNISKIKYAVLSVTAIMNLLFIFRMNGFHMI